MKPYGGTERTYDRYHSKDYLDKGSERQRHKRMGWQEYAEDYYRICVADHYSYDVSEWQEKNNERLNCNGCCGCCCHTDVPLEKYIIN